MNVTPTQSVTRLARRRGVEVVTRSQWECPDESQYARRRRTHPHAPLPSDTLWQHITVTHDDGRRMDDFAADMRELHRIGNERFGSGISYNAVWDMHTGMIGIGQSFDAKGTHTIVYRNDLPDFSRDQNYKGLAIAAIGVPGNRPRPVALHKLGIFISAMIDSGVLTRGHDYKPHSFAVDGTSHAKDCPTDAIRKVMPNIHHIALLNSRTKG